MRQAARRTYYVQYIYYRVYKSSERSPFYIQRQVSTRNARWPPPKPTPLLLTAAWGVPPTAPWRAYLSRRTLAAAVLPPTSIPDDTGPLDAECRVSTVKDFGDINTRQNYCCYKSCSKFIYTGLQPPQQRGINDFSIDGR